MCYCYWWSNWCTALSSIVSFLFCIPSIRKRECTRPLSIGKRYPSFATLMFLWRVLYNAGLPFLSVFIEAQWMVVTLCISTIAALLCCIPSVAALLCYFSIIAALLGCKYSAV